MSREISDEQEGQYYELSTEPAGTLSVTGLEKIEPLTGQFFILKQGDEIISREGGRRLEKSGSSLKAQRSH